MSVKSIVGGDLTLDNLDVTTINGLPPSVGGSQTLAQTLVLGNSAGSTSLNMNSQNISGVTTINGLAYPPASSVGTLAAVLLTGNSAGSTSLNMNSQDIAGVTTINGVAYPPASSAGTIVNGANPAAPVVFALLSETQRIDSVTLTAGVWNISMAYVVGITADPVNASFIQTVEGYLTDGAIGSSDQLRMTNSAMNPDPTTTGLLFSSNATFSYTANIVVVVSVSTTFNLDVNCVYASSGSQGSLAVDNPVTTSTQYLTATRLA